MSLFDWLRAHGAEIGPVEVRGQGRGRGVFALRDLGSGELVGRVPPGLLLSNDVAARAGAGGLGPEPAEGAVLTAGLLALRGDPFWAPYLQDLPSEVEGHPASWSAAVRRELRGSTLADLLPDLDARLRREVASLRASGRRVSWSEWTGARHLVTSRRFEHPAEREGGAAGSTLIPFVDLLNHRLDPEVEWTWEAGACVLRTRRDVPAGSELHISYGRKPNTRFLLSYGFALPDNPDDDVLLPLPGDDLLILPRLAHRAAAKVLPRLSARGIDRGRFRGLLGARREALDGERPGLPADALLLLAGERAILDEWLAATLL